MLISKRGQRGLAQNLNSRERNLAMRALLRIQIRDPRIYLVNIRELLSGQELCII